MSCHRIRRALLGMTRFGEFGPDSELHLDHLAACRACRDEVGCDRELIRQLRAALAARVEALEPRATVWDQVRELAQQPERGRFRWPWRRAADAVGVSRSLTAMAGTGLALVLALNTQVVTVVQQPASDAASPLAASAGTGGMPSAWDRLPRLGDPDTSLPAEQTRLILSARPDPEGLIVNVDAAEVTASLAAPEEAAVEAPPATETFFVTLPLAPEPPPASAGGDRSQEPEPAAPAPPEAGQPT